MGREAAEEFSVAEVVGIIFVEIVLGLSSWGVG